jgi:acyl-CoA synthetase (AMP-forming)/AMP-acid ligase II
MNFRSPRPDVTIPDRPLTELLFESAEPFGDKPAFIDGPTGRTLTFRQWIDHTRRAAAGLQELGLGKGDVMAIFSPNLPEYAVAFHAVSLAGGIVTTANPLYTAEELYNQLMDSGAKLLVTVPAFLEKVRAAAEGTSVRKILVFPGDGDRGDTMPFDDLLSAGGEPRPVPIDPANDVVVLPYSSGTTGLPKGVMLTHRNLVANVEQSIAAMEGFDSEQTILGLLPFFHIYGMVCIMHSSLRIGATVVTMPRFEMEAFLGTLESYRVTHAHLVPPVILGLAKHPAVDRYDLSALWSVTSGAAPLGAETARACAERVDCSVLQGYGLTETSPVTHLATRAQGADDPGTIGPTVANTEMKIVDPETRESLPAGERGEVCIRGPQVMKGYLGRPDATAAMIDDEGWLHTGDIGYAGEDGRTYIVDRVKELIKYKGAQVAPAELEALLLTHPAVADAAVVGIPDEQAGEIPKAFLVLRDEVALDELIAFVAEHVAPHKKIRLAERVERIPRSASGKILRRVLAGRET